MTIPNLFSETMKEDLVLVGISLHFRGQCYFFDMVLVAEVANASVRIENVLRVDAFQKNCAGRRIRPDLYSIAQSDDHKPGAVTLHFVTHGFEQ